MNLTIRMGNHRMFRLTNAFSKKWSNHEAMMNLFFGVYNFCKVHSTIRVTPAMEAGISQHVWSIQDIVNMANSTNRTMAATVTSLGDFGLAKELRKLGTTLPPPAPEVEEPPARVVPWLVAHYDPPPSLTESSDGETDTALEAAAKVYLVRARKETFIEWLWRHYPPEKTACR